MAYVGAQRPVGLLVLILVFSRLAIAAPAVVYDNTTTPTSGDYAPNGFWPFYAFDASDHMGDQITLAGTCREIVEFNLILSSSQLVNLSSLTLAFHDIIPDGKHYPGDEIWTTTVDNISVNGITTVAFSVPNVVVPDTFVWVASGEDPTKLSGLATYDLPMVGASGDYYWDYEAGAAYWWYMNFGGDPVANFGAKVLVVPEPTTLGLLALGGLLAFRRKRR